MVEHPKFIIFQGKKYRLSTGNYYRTENQGKNGPCNLHRAIWEFYYKCKIPVGHCVHHIDGNTFNNEISNLELIHKSDHAKNHLKKRIEEGTLDNMASLLSAQEAAKSWHSSKEGRAWHKLHGENTWKNRKLFPATCLICGKEMSEAYPGKKRFCGPNCQQKHRKRSGKDKVERSCVICGSHFKADKYSKIKTCSKNCSNISMSKTKRCL